jgi:hypothetical protein
LLCYLWERWAITDICATALTHFVIANNSIASQCHEDSRDKRTARKPSLETDPRKTSFCDDDRHHNVRENGSADIHFVHHYSADAMQRNSSRIRLFSVHWGVPLTHLRLRRVARVAPRVFSHRKIWWSGESRGYPGSNRFCPLFWPHGRTTRGYLDQLVAVQIAVDGTRPNPGLAS